MAPATAVYVLTTLVAAGCALLLLRGYRRSRSRLLLWTGLCFVGLTAENALLCADVVIFPDISLAVWRGLPTLAGLGILLYGLIWEAR
jgi:hypothetical protein